MNSTSWASSAVAKHRLPAFRFMQCACPMSAKPAGRLCCKVNHAESLFDALIAAGAQPAGIFAQSSMRIEKRFLAFGHDLDTDLNPVQAGLGFTLDWSSEFIGKSALLTDSPSNSRKPDWSVSSSMHVDARPLGNEPVYHQGRNSRQNHLGKLRLPRRKTHRDCPHRNRG